MSDSEHEPGLAGDEPSVEAAPSVARDEPAFQPRRFRGWDSARGSDDDTTLWSRMRTRVASMFRRGHGDEPLEPVVEESRSETNQAIVDAPTVERTFVSVEDALPAPASPSLPYVATAGPLLESTPGLFARLIRRSKSVRRPSLEIEVHEDRIAAAADAIGAVGEQTFGGPVAARDPFASVEEALPGDNRRLAPPPDLGDTLEVVRDTSATAKRPPAPEPDFGRTLEIVPEFDRTQPVPDLGKTLDMDLAPVPGVRLDASTADANPNAPAERDSAAYFGDTLDPAVIGPPLELIETDTDEFQVVRSSTDLPVPPPMPGLDEDTAQVSRKSLIESLLFWRAKAKAEGALGSTIVEAPPAFLFSKFRTFYNEIIRFKHQKTEFTAGFSTAIVTEYSADLSPDGAADILSKKLAAMLELQAAEAMWMGGESAERYPDAQYAMAALADETFLNLEWEGQGAWYQNLLEAKLFRTRCADVELFRRLDKLLKDQPNSAAARDLARVYLLVLAAGFRGKYRPFGLTRALAEYRQRLYEYIHMGGDALMIYAPERRIFPEAAQRTLEGVAVSRFTAAQRWGAILAILAVGYTAVAHLAWSRVSEDLRDVTERIEIGSTMTPATP